MQALYFSVCGSSHAGLLAELRTLTEIEKIAASEDNLNVHCFFTTDRINWPPTAVLPVRLPEERTDLFTREIKPVHVFFSWDTDGSEVYLDIRFEVDYTRCYTCDDKLKGDELSCSGCHMTNCTPCHEEYKDLIRTYPVGSSLCYKCATKACLDCLAVEEASLPGGKCLLCDIVLCAKCTTCWRCEEGE